MLSERVLRKLVSEQNEKKIHDRIANLVTVEFYNNTCTVYLPILALLIDNGLHFIDFMNHNNNYYLIIIILCLFDSIDLLDNIKSLL